MPTVHQATCEAETPPAHPPTRSVSGPPFQRWLNTLCELQHSAQQSVVVQRDNTSRCLARWPHNLANHASLLDVADKVAQKKRCVVQLTSDPLTGKPVNPIIGLPLPDGKSTLVVECCAAGKTARKESIDQLAQAVEWLRVALPQRDTESSTPAALQEALAIISTQESAHAACSALATYLAERYDCDRVCIGFRQRQHLRIEATSHCAQFQPHSPLMALVASAMSEAIALDATITRPSSSACARTPSLIHDQLAHEMSVCTAPIVYAGKLCGAFCLQWGDRRRLPSKLIRDIEDLASAIGPLLILRQRDEQPLWRRGATSLRYLGTAPFGPRHPGAKLTALAAIIALTSVSLFPLDYRVTAEARIEGRIQRVMVAPIDGFIATAEVRAGDVVQEGQLLGRLDDRELKLERSQRVSERQQYQREYRDALAQRDRVAARIAQTRMAQAEASIALLDKQLSRISIVSPFSGVVTDGDLSQALGAPVKRGDALFTLAPLDHYRVIVEVDERDIEEINIGQQGLLRLASRQHQPLAFNVESITSVATAMDGRNHFRVEGSLQAGPSGLLPGMRGIGKIDIESRSLLWVATHRLTEWLQLRLWALWP